MNQESNGHDVQQKQTIKYKDQTSFRDKILKEGDNKEKDFYVEKHLGTADSFEQDASAKHTSEYTSSKDDYHNAGVDVEKQTPPSISPHQKVTSTKSSSPASSTIPISQPPCHPDTTYPEGGFRAYSVVFGSFCAMVAGFGLMNSVGTFQAYFSTHQLSNYSESTIGWIFSIYVFLSFFCGVQIGPVFDAKGPRWLVAGGSVCLVGGVMGLAESTSKW